MRLKSGNMLGTDLCMSDVYRTLTLNHACVARSLLQGQVYVYITSAKICALHCWICRTLIRGVGQLCQPLQLQPATVAETC